MSRITRAGALGANIPPPVTPPNDETCEHARSYLTRTGNADLIPILGLDQDNRLPGHCRQCGEPLSIARSTSRGKNEHRDYCTAYCARQARAALTEK